MKLAVLADIHSNHVALETCIAYIEKQEIDHIFFLGDYIGDLACPEKTMKLLYETKNRYHCTFIRGNKENYWINHRQHPEEWKDQNSITGTMFYAYSHLTTNDIEFFTSMPIRKDIQLAKKDITICHGSPRKVNETMRPDVCDPYAIVKDIESSLILCAHYHIQTAYEKNGKIVLNPGAVGVPLYCFEGGVSPVCGRIQPKEGRGITQFLILEEKGTGWNPEFISLEYDLEKVIEELYQEQMNIHAPGWCAATENLLRNGRVSHATVLKKVMALCEQNEKIYTWPDFPDQFWEQAIQELS